MYLDVLPGGNCCRTISICSLEHTGGGGGRNDDDDDTEGKGDLSISPTCNCLMMAREVDITITANKHFRSRRYLATFRGESRPSPAMLLLFPPIILDGIRIGGRHSSLSLILIFMVVCVRDPKNKMMMINSLLCILSREIIVYDTMIVLVVARQDHEDDDDEVFRPSLVAVVWFCRHKQQQPKCVFGAPPHLPRKIL